MMRVLLVEDNDLIGQILYDIFQEEGHVVDWKRRGNEGKKAIREESHDIILLDANIPHCSGLELLALIREKDVKKPVIILTAQADYETRYDYLSAGANEFVTKPFDVEKLLQTMSSLVSEYGEAQQ